MYSGTHTAEMQQTPMTVSQLSGVIDSHHKLEAATRLPNGDPTILQQFKECSEANEQALRDAKNIKELIGINVKTVDKQLFMRSRGHSLAGQPMDETNPTKTKPKAKACILCTQHGACRYGDNCIENMQNLTMELVIKH